MNSPPRSTRTVFGKPTSAQTRSRVATTSSPRSSAPCPADPTRSGSRWAPNCAARSTSGSSAARRPGPRRRRRSGRLRPTAGAPEPPALRRLPTRADPHRPLKR
jgi:hypothetical protein